MARSEGTSGNISDFWRCWLSIIAKVEEMYELVKDKKGTYGIHFELVWDCEDEAGDDD